MKPVNTLAGIVLMLLVSGCGGSKYAETINKSNSLYLEGDYEASLILSEQVITEMESRGKNASAEIYALAGISAFEQEEYDKSLAYLEKARELEHSGSKLFVYLAKNYRRIDNLSKEITALKTYLEKYPEGEHAKEISKRLFSTCLESENFTLAGELWNQFDSTEKADIDNMEVYLVLNSKQDRADICNELGERILELDPKNETALGWFAETLFWRAENLYQEQMKAYKANRTHKQYAILLEAFKQVNADFKKSLEYYLRLYELSPSPEYASYLARIYTRLENKKKADYYSKLAG